jgi:hypothetical protein
MVKAMTADQGDVEVVQETVMATDVDLAVESKVCWYGDPRQGRRRRRRLEGQQGELEGKM